MGFNSAFKGLKKKKKKYTSLYSANITYGTVSSNHYYSDRVLVQGHRKMNRLGKNGRTNDSLPSKKLRVEVCLFQQHSCRQMWRGYCSTAMYRDVSEILSLITKYPGCCPSKYADAVGYSYCSGSYTAGSTSLTLFWRSVLVFMSRKV